MIEPSQVAGVAGIEHDIAWAIIRVRVHFLKASRAVVDPIEFVRVDREGAVVGSLVLSTELIDDHPQRLSWRDESATVTAKANLEARIEYSDFEGKHTLGALEFCLGALRGNGDLRVFHFVIELKAIAGSTVMMRLPVNG